MNRQYGRQSVAIALGIVAAFLSAVAFAADAPPKASELGPAGTGPTILPVVDGRVELVSVVFRLAGAEPFSSEAFCDYQEESAAYFAPFAEHDAVKQAKALWKDAGLDAEAVFSLACHLGPAPDYALGETEGDPLPPTLDGRWTAERLAPFTAALRAFSSDTKFGDFLAQYDGYFKKCEECLAIFMRDTMHLDLLSAYFGDQKTGPYLIAPGFYASKALISVPCRSCGEAGWLTVVGFGETDWSGLPVLSEEAAGSCVQTFCRMRAEALAEAHWPELEESAGKLYDTEGGMLRLQGVLDARVLIVESLTHAFMVRYLKAARDERTAESELDKRKMQGFTWLPQLLKTLDMYEQNRFIYGTLELYMPNIVAFFDGIEAKPLPSAAPSGETPGNPAPSPIEKKGDDDKEGEAGPELVA